MKGLTLTFGLGLKYFKTPSSPFSVCRVEAFQDSDDSELRSSLALNLLRTCATILNTSLDDSPTSC